VRVSLKAVSGVDSVEVNLEKGGAFVKMKPANTATLKQIHDAIAKNGFAMKQSTATIAGTVVQANGQAQLRVSGSNEMLELTPDVSAASIPLSLDGKSVLVEGTIPEASKGKSPDSIRYHPLKEENSK
jgi:cation transport ATPase